MQHKQVREKNDDHHRGRVVVDLEGHVFRIEKDFKQTMVVAKIAVAHTLNN